MNSKKMTGLQTYRKSIIKTFFAFFFIFTSLSFYSQGLINSDIYRGDAYVYGFATQDVSLSPTTIYFPHNGVIKNIILLTYSEIPNLSYVPKDFFTIGSSNVSFFKEDIFSFVELNFDYNQDHTGAIGYYIYKKELLGLIDSTSTSIILPKNWTAD